jgi:hypothetical protein
LALALLARLPWLLKADKFLDADHAVWGLMARHIVQGLHWPIYMYGQGYMGAGEAYLLAPVFALWGSSPWVMGLAISGLFLLTLLLSAMLIRRLAGTGLALGALVLATLAPPFFIRLSLLSYGGYVTVPLLGVLFWLVWSRAFILAPGLQAGRGGWRLWLLAALAALGWWTWPVFWFFILPCALWHLAALGRALRQVSLPVREAVGPRWLAVASKAGLGLGAAYLAYALAVWLGGASFAWRVGGRLLLSTDPHLAVRQDLPAALALLLLAWALRRWPRLGREGLGRWWQAGRAHWLGLAAMAGGLAVKHLAGMAHGLSRLAAWGDHVPPIQLASPSRMLSNLELLWTQLLPRAWVPHAPFDHLWLGRLLALAVVAACLGVALDAWRGARREGRDAWLRAHWLPAACACSQLALLAVLIFGTAAVDRFSVRYLAVSIVWWPLLLAWGVRSLWRRVRWAGALAGAGVAGVLGAAVLAVALHPAAWATTSWREHYAPVIQLMEKEGVRHGWADYWEAYKLSFLSGERYIFSPREEFPDGQVRYSPYQRRVERAFKKIYLFRRGVDDGARRKVLQRLAARGVPFRQKDLGRWRAVLVGAGS